MEKREQRIRRDRRRDGKRNTFQNEQGKETFKQQDTSVEKKKNDAPNVEVSNKKNSSEDKDKTVEDDPLRFANLKRETDEIAALKAKKPHKRQVFSNWSKYEEPLPSEDESRAVDFESLLHAPQSGGFRFKSEQQWNSGSYGQFGELFTPDAELLVGGLTSVPFYERLGILKALFSDDEIERMDCCAKTNYIAYEKLNKSKPKRKVAVTDLFKLDQADKYAVTDGADGPAVDASVVRPVFSVEESPEEAPAEVPLPAPPAEPSDRGTGIAAPLPEGERVERGFDFGKPPPSPYAPAGSRERTPLRDDGRDRMSPVLRFEKAPPPSYASGNRKSPFHSRESTPAKETAPVAASRDSGSSEGREGLPDPAGLPIRERETVQKLREDRQSVSEEASDVPARSISPRGGAPARERQQRVEHGALRESSPVQKVVEDRPQVAAFTPREVKRNVDKTPSQSSTLGKEEIEKSADLQRNGADMQEEETRQNSPSESEVASEHQSDEYGQVNTEKKKGKPDVRKVEGQQRGGGRQGRRKKGQNAPGRAVEQLPVEAADVSGAVAEPETESAVQAVTKACVPGEVPRPAEEKPERTPPPAVPHQQPALPPLSTQPESRRPQPVCSEPREPKDQMVKPAPPDTKAEQPQRKTAQSAKVAAGQKERATGGRADDAGLDFLMSLRGQKAGGVSEVEAARAAAGAAVARSAIEEDEMKESQKAKPVPAIATEKKEDLEDWLDSMLDD